MKTLETLTNTLTILLLAVSPAFAADTTRTYHSGILVLLFLGLFAVIVVAQMVPAIVMLLGIVKGVAGAAKKGTEKESEAAEKPGS